ncbi:DUF4214 domain-containing protein [Duganella sp. FT92W]|uniref:DUF4214 domain-containing protein n=1 Tax=Pseudoduganella rivuli TaxID=2666085 RepID=A0A7X2LW16_9BURK|nr:DUF4214 domain-containing protein [Pseudoduganella rivuli]MRV76096.1 DUF4214 domain-containing protein [Pseudoduganella rivuli]
MAQLNITGGAGDDILNGTDGDDSLDGAGGSDLLCGFGGDDRLAGGEGDDRLEGGSGNDVLDGGAGNDVLVAGAGRDTLRGGPGNDFLGLVPESRGSTAEGGDGDDEISSGGNGNTLDGGNGDDVLRADVYSGPEPGIVRLAGGNGNDTLYVMTGGARAAPAEMSGGAGRDRFIIGGATPPTPHVITDFEPGIDTIEFTLASELSPDTNPFGPNGYLRASQHGADAVIWQDDDGAAGRSASERAFVVLKNTLLASLGAADFFGMAPDGSTAGLQWQGTDDDGSVNGSPDSDRLAGGAGNDSLYGHGSNDVIGGGDGNDRLWGGGGNDQLTGGNGDDQLTDDYGNDNLSGGDGNDVLTDYGGTNQLDGGNGNDSLTMYGSGSTMSGGAGNDVMSGHGDGNVLSGGDGADRLTFNGSRNVLSGGDGDDVLHQDNGDNRLDGGNGDDKITIMGGNNFIQGGAGNDVITMLADRAFADGGDGNDIIAARGGASSGSFGLYGGNGNDWLSGSAGNDIVDGGSGIDTVAFLTAYSNVLITATGGGYRVQDLAGFSGTDTVRGAERLAFIDSDLRIQYVALDVDGAAGKVYRLLHAAFDRRPDDAGLDFWLGVADRGTDLTEIARHLTRSGEFETLYGAAPANGEFITQLYRKALHREPDAGGYAYWLDALDNQRVTRADMLAAVAESQEHVEAVAEMIGGGIVFYGTGLIL